MIKSGETSERVIFMAKQVLFTSRAPAAIGPYSQAILAGNTLYTSGQIGLIPSTGAMAEGIENQTRQVLENLGHVLEEAGMSFENVVKTTVFLADMEDFPLVNAIYAQSFPVLPPARSCVAVQALPKGARVEIECIAVKE